MKIWNQSHLPWVDVLDTCILCLVPREVWCDDLQTRCPCLLTLCCILLSMSCSASYALGLLLFASVHIELWCMLRCVAGFLRVLACLFRFAVLNKSWFLILFFSNILIRNNNGQIWSLTKMYHLFKFARQLMYNITSTISFLQNPSA